MEFNRSKVSSGSWEVSTFAEPKAVRRLRRAVCGHLMLWGLEELVDVAQLCVSELVSNVITHIGSGTPLTLAVSVRGAHLRVEVHDPDERCLPTLLSAGPDAESGRGLSLVDSLADRWGVVPTADGKATWCELSIIGRPDSWGGTDDPGLMTGSVPDQPGVAK